MLNDVGMDNLSYEWQLAKFEVEAELALMELSISAMAVFAGWQKQINDIKMSKEEGS